MRRAVTLAKRGLGRTRPNPVVGCVVEHGGRIVGEGWHRVAGGSHAEIEALDAAGDWALGSTLHVTLEPCNHQGRTGACTTAILKSGVARVVFGTVDPMHGGGGDKLRDAGVEVVRADDPAAARVNEAWLTAAPRRRPFVALKTASSLDGRIATASGASRWITGPAARRAVHRLRDQYDAVLVGAGTLRVDDPQLTARIRGGRHPIRVAIDTRLECPADARILSDDAPTWLIAGRRTSGKGPPGAEVIPVPTGSDGRVDLAAVLEKLWERDVVSVLCEGGASLGGALLQAGFVDRLYSFVAPMLLGDDGAPLVRLGGPAAPRDALRLADIRRTTYGDDVLITGRLPD